MTQIVTGLVSFWLDNEYTYGSVESYDLSMANMGLTHEEHSTYWASISREHVLAHEKFQEIFAPYAAAIGIDKPQELESWTTVTTKIKNFEANKIKAEEERLAREAKEAEEKALREKEAKERYLIENHRNIVNDYFRKLREKNMLANNRVRV